MKTKLVASLVKSSSTALSALLLALSALTASALPIITNVIETGGDNEATDTVTAKWTGVTFTNGIAGEYLTPFLVPRFAEEVPAMVDRVHQWNGVATNLPLPSYLVGGEYIMIGNDNRDNNPFKLDVTVSVPSIVFLLVDNRQGDADNATPPQAGRPLSGWTNMTWVGTSGFVPVMNGLNRTASRAVPDEVGYDENGDAVGAGGSIQNAASVYVKSVPAGTFTLLQADNAGQNMYGVVVKAASDPSAQANLPAEFGQTVNGFQDSFDGATLNASWKARGPATNIYSLANGILSVTNAIGDPNHLLYEAAGYNSTNQEVLARIRINRFGTNDLARAGIGASVGITNSQGINYHFRNEGAGAVHTEFLDDARQWGPELSFKWQTNVWYWMRLKHEPNTATNVDAFAKVWVA
ncbi:MAG: hypothetical protein EXS30_12235, partial [Pedosphaera sp.]|nr:hypothetical protein [Pedosphaera sp.]